ncbi:MAG: flavohemoprotein [Deltaproteobacteria bacterium]|nr:flavohemoprotein [Deltaproteobacteria bacterium]
MERPRHVLLRESFDIALSRDDDFPNLLYDILFHRHPELEALFLRNTRSAQRKMFGATLAAIVDHDGDVAWGESHLFKMGRTHVDYGVTAEMYPYVGDALVEALAEVCAETWTPEHEGAWRAAFADVTRHMLAGAAAATEGA